MTKDEFLRQLREDEAFNGVLSAARDDKERRAIKIHAESFMTQFFQDVLDPLQKLVENDPELLKKTLEEIQTELIMSGSGEPRKNG